MALLSVQQQGKGTTPVPVAVSASDTVASDGNSILWLEVINAGGSPDTVTIVDAGVTPAGSVATNPTMSVPATTGRKFYSLTPNLANQSGIITINHSFTTSVTCNIHRFS